MRIIDQFGINNGGGFVFETVIDQIARQRLAGKLANRFAWITMGEQSEDASAFVPDLIAVGFNYHAVGQRRMARSDRVGDALERNHTEPAGAIRVKPGIVAQRRNIYADGTKRLKNRAVLLKLVALTVNRRSKHRLLPCNAGRIKSSVYFCNVATYSAMTLALSRAVNSGYFFPSASARKFSPQTGMSRSPWERTERLPSIVAITSSRG